MKKKLGSLTALLLSAVFIFAGDAAVAQNKPTNSKVAAKPLAAAKASLDAKRFQEAITRLKEIQTLQGRNAYDDHLVNEMLSYAYLSTKQYGEAVKILEPMLDSEFVPRSDVPRRVRQLAQTYYVLKNYDKVIAMAERAEKGGFADDQIQGWQGEAYYLKGDYKNAAKFVESEVASQIKAGKKPKEQTLLLVQSACDKTGDRACLQRTYERLVTYYPKAQYWQNLVDQMYRAEGDQTLLQVYRLAAAVDVLKKPSDYTEFAQLALEAGSPGEAQAILERGFEKKIFVQQRDQDRNRRLLEAAKKQAAEDRAALEKKASEAAAAKVGEPDVSLGVAYLGYQQYDKAVEAFNRGLGKPGLKNAAEARLMLGIAQLRAGRKDQARKAFQQVKGDPTLERLANLWSLHAQGA